MVSRETERLDAIDAKPHGVIPGGYTNNDKVLIDKVNLDEVPRNA